ncbi:MAG: shikimate kinase [Dokdonella sp.]
MIAASNLILVGPMGAGKTTIGRQLAEQLVMPFVDLDHEIEQRTGASVALIFEVEGEAAFRQRESQMLQQLLERHGILLATGGGAVLSQDNRKLMRERGFVLWLDTSVAVQLDRLARDHLKRPLLQTPDREQRLNEMAQRRNPLYAECADATVVSNGRHPGPHAIAHIVEAISSQWQRLPK